MCSLELSKSSILIILQLQKIGLVIFKHCLFPLLKTRYDKLGTNHDKQEAVSVNIKGYMRNMSTVWLTSIHFWWELTESQDKPMAFTFLFWNSGVSLATLPSSVVQTGVKSAGWEKRTPHLKTQLCHIGEKTSSLHFQLGATATSLEMN